MKELNETPGSSSARQDEGSNNVKNNPPPQLNNKGAILIIAYIALFVLITLSAGIARFNVNELSNTRRYYHSAAAFWLAESGINLFMKDTQMLDQTGSHTILEENGTLNLTKDDSDPRERVVTATGNFAGRQKIIQITYQAKAPVVFRNTVSVKGNLVITGKKSMIAINDKARLSGNILDQGKHSSVFIEDKNQRVSPGLVSLTYPDADKNGVADEFGDFVQFNRDTLKNYPSKEILYIKGNGTYMITPASLLGGKRILYVEGEEGGGSVVIQFGGGLEKDQELTVISTGTVIHNQTGFAPTRSQLNIIAWSGYWESAALPASHNGMIYTHGVAHFDNIYDTSVTNGGIVANGGITVGEVWSTKTFNYADTTTDDIVPAGFEGLVGGGASGYVTRPKSWKAI